VPVYDYRCSLCGREVEVIHGIHDPGPATCDACGGPMRKALSAPAIHFKGSGWAKKDARAAAKPAAPSSGGKEGSPDAGGGSAQASGEGSAPASGQRAGSGTEAGSATGSGAGASGSTPSGSSGNRPSGSSGRAGSSGSSGSKAGDGAR
jgi:putative FmdB family regulatory protein